MGKRIRMRLSVGLLVTAVCLFAFFSVQTKATDAFVVEEEAVIGEPEQAESAAPVLSQPLVPEQHPEKKTEKAAEKKAEKVREKVEPSDVPEAVSQNAVSQIFRVPVRRKDTESVCEEFTEEPTEETTEEQVLKEEQADAVSREETGKGWILIVIGSIFLFGGIIRILHRLCIRCGKL